MIRYALFFIVLIAFLGGCEGNDSVDSMALKKDTIAPIINVPDSIITVLLQVSSSTLISNGANSYTWLPGPSGGDYEDDAPTVLDDINGEMRCAELSLVTTGSVNNKTVGEYTLTYNAEDAAGNKAKPVTKKVRIVENDINFLSGNYSVTCSCTKQLKNSDKTVLSTEHYTTSLLSSPALNNEFNLSHLKVADYYVKPFSIRVKDTKLEVHFYDPAFDLSSNSSTGTLSASKSTFTIESTGYLYSPVTKYTCKNSFTKITN